MASLALGRLAPVPSVRPRTRAWLAPAFAALVVACAPPGTEEGGTVSSGITYGGPTRWTITGPEGGPFADTSLVVPLQNPGNEAVAWTASSVPSFVHLDQLGGVIQPDAQAEIRADLVVAVAQALAPGTYLETLVFHNESTAQPDVEIECFLVVQSQGASSDLSPATNFASRGPASGPFVPDSAAYSLTNTGSLPLSWQANASDPWIGVAPASGVLAPGASVDVVLSIDDPSTAALQPGMHAAVVDWIDAATSAILHTRSVDLDVLHDSTSGGWTAFTPSADTRVVYVSSSTGNDGNNGLSESAPKRTLGAGMAQLRNGFPDWLLLKTGDAWDEAFGWVNSGRSLDEPLLISSYGTSPDRPVVRTGNSTGLHGFNVHDVATVGIRFVANSYDGAAWIRAIEFVGGSRNLLIEDCVCEGYNNGLVFTGAVHANLAIRRNVIIDSYDMASTQGSGIYMSDTSGVLIEENVIDNNGSTPAHPASGWPGHNIYCQNGTDGVVIRGNIISRTDGVQLRGGGVMENNLFLKNAISISVGGGVQPDGGGVTATVRNNVVLDGNDFPASGPYSGDGARGWGIHSAGNITQATIQSNVVAHNVSGHGPRPVQFGVASNGRGVENTVFSDNVVYAWNGSTVFQGNAGQTVNVQMLNNKFQNEITAEPLIVHDQAGSTSTLTSAQNVFDTLAGPNACMKVAGGLLSLPQWQPLVHDTTSIEQPAPFPDPGRTIATYHQSIGGAPSLEAFLAGARQQSKANWRAPYTADAVNDYIRAGFGISEAGIAP